jgi:hypothetical protein
MKERRFGLVMLVIVLAFGMTVVGCNNDDGGGTIFDGTWTNDDEGYELVASGGSFTVSMGGNPVFRGTYTVSGNDVAITFTGMYTDSGWTDYQEDEENDLPPKNITGTIKGNQFTIEGNDDMTFTKKGGGSSGGSTTPGGGGNGGGGGNSGGNQNQSSIFVLTGMPNDFNGKHYYVMFYAEDNYGNPIISAVSDKTPGTSCDLIEIQNGKVSLPMWVMHEGSFTRYHGDETVNGSIMIFEYKTVQIGTKPTNPKEEKFFSVAFSDGAATKTWDQGQSEPIGGGSSGGGGSGDGDKPVNPPGGDKSSQK